MSRKINLYAIKFILCSGEKIIFRNVPGKKLGEIMAAYEKQLNRIIRFENNAIDLCSIDVILSAKEKANESVVEIRKKEKDD
jgi:hypothetical protein